MIRRIGLDKKQNRKLFGLFALFSVAVLAGLLSQQLLHSSIDEAEADEVVYSDEVTNTTERVENGMRIVTEHHEHARIPFITVYKYPVIDQVTGAAVPPPQNVGGTNYYRVTSTDSNEDSGDEVCTLATGTSCVGYVDESVTGFNVCKAYNPTAAEVSGTDGDVSVTYCDGAPQAAPCSGLTNTCLACPTCTNGVACNEAIGGLYREMYVTCAAASNPVGLNGGTTTLISSSDLVSQVSTLSSSQGAYDWTIGGTSFATLNVPFDNGAGPTDFSGNAGAISFIGTPTLTTSGCQVGVCYEFNGLNQQIDINLPLSTLMTDREGAISVWAKPVATGPIVTHPYSGDAIVSTSFYTGISQATVSGDDRIWAYTYDNNADRVGTTYASNAWNHLVWVHTGGKLQLYRDGSFVAEIESGTIGAMNQEFRIGGASAFGNHFEGFIDEVQVYSSALSPSQISQLYTDGASGLAGPRTIHSEHTAATEVWDLTVTPITSGGAIGVATASSNDVTISADPVTVALNSGTTTLDTYTTLASNVTGVLPAGAAYQWTENASPFLQVYYPFNNSLTQTDLSGNSRNGVVTGAGFSANWQNECKVGGCLFFDGLNDQVDLNITLSTVMSDIEGSYSVWAKPTSSGPVVSNSYSGDAVISTSFYTGISQATISGQDRFWAYNYDNNEDRVGTVYASNDWNHLVWVHGGGKLRLYRDGVLVDSVESGNTGAINQELRVGWASAFGNPFQGYIDEVQIYDFALSANQVQNLYNDGNAGNPGPTQLDAFELNAADVFGLSVTPLSQKGTVLSATNSSNTVTISNPTISATLNSSGTTLSTFNDLTSVATGLTGIRAAYEWTENATPYMQLNMPFNNGNTLFDYSGNSRNGVRTGAAWSPREQGLCKVGGCLFFDGLNDQVDMNITLSTVMSANEGTYSVWAKPTASAPVVGNSYSGDAVISTSFYTGISQANIGGQDRFWAFNYDTNEDRVGVAYSNDTWTHLVWVHGGGQLQLYKDGVLVGSTASGNTGATNQEIRIGWASAFGNPFQGYIDEVQVWDFALSAAQISQIYTDNNAGLSGPTVIQSQETVGTDTWQVALTPLEEDSSTLTKVTVPTTVTITVPSATLNLNAGNTSLSTSNDLVPTISGTGDPGYALSWVENGSSYLSSNYPMNLGATQNDYSGNGYNATVSEGAFSPQGQGFCQVGGCFFFDGVNDQLDTNQPQSSFMSDTDGTMSVWIRPTGAAPVVGNSYSGDAAISASFYSGISQASIGGLDRIWAFNYDTDEDRIGAEYTINEWAHFVWVHSGGQLRLYKNGVLVDSILSGNTGAMNQEVRIGWASAFGNPFQGYIDEVQTFSNGLTQSQITQLYNDGNANIPGPSRITSSETIVADVWNLSVTPFKGDGSPLSSAASTNTVTIAAPAVTVGINNGLTIIDPSQNLTSQVTGLGPAAAAYEWEVNGSGFASLNIPFNPGNTQVDYSGNNFDATTTGAAYSIEAEGNCQVGGCHFYDGVNDQDDVNQPMSALMSASTGSVSLWMRPTGAAPIVGNSYSGDTAYSTSFYTGISQANIGGQDRIWAFNYDIDEDRIGTTYTIDQWTHIVWVHDGGQLSMYQDGSLVGSIASGDTGATNQEVRIGWASAFGNPFQGYIDEVQVYSTALSADQITILYNDGNAGNAGPTTIADEHVNLNDTWNLTVTPFESDGTPFTPNNSGNTTTGFINTPPSAPTLVTPLDGATIAAVSPTLTATYNDIDAGHVGTVEFRISSGSSADCINNVSVVNSGSSATTATISENASYTVGVSLTDGNTYNWCARSDDTYDQSNGGVFSSMGAFTIDLGNEPNIPVLKSPDDASITADTTPDLSATYSDPDIGDVGVTEYRISSGTAADCLSNTNVVWSGSSASTTTNNEITVVTVGIALTNLATYNWCARNNDGIFGSNSGNFTTMGSFQVDIDYSPGSSVVNTRRDQSTTTETPTQSGPVVDDLNISLLVTDSNREALSSPTSIDKLLIVSFIIDNPTALTATDVTANMLLPEYLLYVPRSLQIDNVIQTDGSDNDPGQANNSGISATWSELTAGQATLVTFQLIFDESAIQQYVDNQDNVLAVANPIITLQADISASNASQTFQSNTVIIEPDTSGVLPSPPSIQPPAPVEPSQPETQEPESSQPETVLPPTEAPTESPDSDDGAEDTSQDSTTDSEESADTTEQPADSESTDSQTQEGESTSDQFRETSEPTQQESEAQQVIAPSSPETIEPIILEPQPTDNGSDIVLTGAAESTDDSVKFSGTSSEPNATVVITINNDLALTIETDENGFWESFVSAQELGIEVAQSEEIVVEAFAVSTDGRESNRLVQNIFLDRQQDGQIIAEPIEPIESPSSTSFVEPIRAIAKQVEKVVVESQPEIQATLAVTAPVVVVSSAPLWGYLPYIPTLTYHFFTWVVGLFGRSKRKQGRLYGIAYDSITKEPVPLAIVRLYSFTDGVRKLVSTVVTDKAGRYESLLEPGEYQIEVVKPQYTFPSALVSGEIDGDYQHLSHGNLTMDETTMSLPDLALDPENAVKKFNVAGAVKKAWLAIQNVGHHLAVPILIVGGAGSTLMLYYSPLNALNWVLTIMYLLMLILQLNVRQHTQKAWGIVYDLATGVALPLVNLQLIDPEFGKVVKSRLSDYEGRFAFLPEPGEYVIKASKPGYSQPEVVESTGDLNPIQGQIEIKKEGDVIDGDIALKQG